MEVEAGVLPPTRLTSPASQKLNLCTFAALCYAATQTKLIKRLEVQQWDQGHGQGLRGMAITRPEENRTAKGKGQEKTGLCGYRVQGPGATLYIHDSNPKAVNATMLVGFAVAHDSHIACTWNVSGGPDPVISSIHDSNRKAYQSPPPPLLLSHTLLLTGSTHCRLGYHRGCKDYRAG